MSNDLNCDDKKGPGVDASEIARCVTFAGKFGRGQNFERVIGQEETRRKTRARLRWLNFGAINVAETYIYYGMCF